LTCIAWDRKSVAADKQASNSGLRHRTTKLRRISSGEVLAWTGDQDSGEMVAKWYEDGADPARWPECQKDKDSWSRLIVVSATGAKVFERQPIATAVEDDFMAWGSGRDFAIGAMARGASAREAVEVAMEFDNCCGLGVDAVDFQ
jgi:ATP-dependent protease HslVU (ClpYQ) peptidase subunit